MAQPVMNPVLECQLGADRVYTKEELKNIRGRESKGAAAE
jgi:hypothetical protein